MHARVTPAVVPPMRWVMWAIPGFLFLIGFFHRAAPGVIARDLMQAFEATGATIGLLAATYFYSYAARGTLVDGARHYPVEAYRDGFGVCAAFAAAAAPLCLLMRETHGRNIYDQLRAPTAREAA